MVARAGRASDEQIVATFQRTNSVPFVVENLGVSRATVFSVLASRGLTSRREAGRMPRAEVQHDKRTIDQLWDEYFKTTPGMVSQALLAQIRRKINSGCVSESGEEASDDDE